jgi:hypothetical protein
MPQPQILAQGQMSHDCKASLWISNNSFAADLKKGTPLDGNPWKSAQIRGE